MQAEEFPLTTRENLFKLRRTPVFRRQFLAVSKPHSSTMAGKALRIMTRIQSTTAAAS